MDATLQIYVHGQWYDAGRLSCPEPAAGYRGRSYFTYDEDYAIAALGREKQGALWSLSCTMPPSFELHTLQTWPAFMLDIVPSGAGRRALVALLGLTDSQAADWPLLLRAGNPIGNVRVAEGVVEVDPHHPGFTREAIIDRSPEFIEYAYQRGGPVAGSSGAQGDAPKFLLTQDTQGRWHSDGVLADERATRHWLVKYPRGRRASDSNILRLEAAYMLVAKRIGLRVAAVPEYDHDTLFVPRFDRQVSRGRVDRIGQESLYALAGVADYGVRLDHLTLCRALARYATRPSHELSEYVRRDVANVALGNTDNHARNTAVARNADGTVALTPLFDFAPMFMDEDGIPRACRWLTHEAAGRIDYNGVLSDLAPLLPHGATRLREELRHQATALRDLPETLRQAGVDDEVIARRAPYIRMLEEDLLRITLP